jgi:hypothetical protein
MPQSEEFYRALKILKKETLLVRMPEEFTAGAALRSNPPSSFTCWRGLRRLVSANARTASPPIRYNHPVGLALLRCSHSSETS